VRSVSNVAWLVVFALLAALVVVVLATSHH
jgi:hypothetical protein